MKNIHSTGLPNYVAVTIILVRINGMEWVFLKMGWASNVGHGRNMNRTAK